MDILYISLSHEQPDDLHIILRQRHLFFDDLSIRRGRPDQKTAAFYQRALVQGFSESSHVRMLFAEDFVFFFCKDQI